MPVKLPGPVPTTSAVDVVRRCAQPGEQLVGIGEHAERARRALGERPPVVDERDRRYVGGGVEREDEAHVASG